MQRRRERELVSAIIILVNCNERTTLFLLLHSIHFVLNFRIRINKCLNNKFHMLRFRYIISVKVYPSEQKGVSAICLRLVSYHKRGMHLAVYTRILIVRQTRTLPLSVSLLRLLATYLVISRLQASLASE